MNKLQFKLHLKPLRKDVISVCDLKSKIAILFGHSPFVQEICFYNTKLYKYLFKLKEISSIKIAKVVSMYQLKTQDFAYSTYESGDYGIEIFIYKIYDNSYTLVSRLCQKTTKENYPFFLNLMDGSFITYINYIQLLHKENKILGNLFNRMFNKFIPYKFSLGKKIQFGEYYDRIVDIIETKPYEVILNISKNNDTLIVYDLKKNGTIKKIKSPWHNFAYFLSKYEDKYLIAKFKEDPKNSYLFFFDINNKYEFVSKIKFNEINLLINEKNNGLIASYFYEFKEWKINELNIIKITDYSFNHYFGNNSHCIITKTNDVIIYTETKGIYIFKYIKK